MSRADPLRIADYLQHIIETIDNIQDYKAGMDLDAFMADRKTRDAVIRNLEVIGEACNNVAKITVDHAIVWQTIRQDLPTLRSQILVLS